MNSRYSILVLKGTRVRRFAVSPRGLRQIVLACVTASFAAGVFFSEFLAAERRKLEAVVANGEAQKQKLSELWGRAKQVQNALAHWTDLRQRIYASLPKQSQAELDGSRQGEALHQFLAVLHDELEAMIASVPSEWPVSGQVVSGIGMRPSPWTGKMVYHAGLDIPNPPGTPVQAPGDAVVEAINGKFGTVVLDHGQEIKTRYAHLSKIFVREGERVRRGQTIAAVGNKGRSTGPHLHYEVRVAGVAIDPRKSLLNAEKDS